MRDTTTRLGPAGGPERPGRGAGGALEHQLRGVVVVATNPHRLILLLVLLVGLALRLFRLGADSLWYDETVSTALAGSPLPELIRHTAGDIHPPGYYVLLRGWLLLTGYPTGHADPGGVGLEFIAGFFSLFFGVLLIALVYTLARHLAGARVALIAAALTALSPYNIWYGQEVRMYTLAAGLGVVATYALLRAITNQRINESANPNGNNPQSAIPLRSAAATIVRNPQSIRWWAVYALAAAAGMYTLYYFAFLLVPLNLWALAHIVHRASNIPHSRFQIVRGLLANLAAALLYAPWIPIAWRQATNPPVPPWRTAPDIAAALAESWGALSLGQSAPGWLWPALALTLGLYGVGLGALWRNQRIGESANRRISESRIRYSPFAVLPLATFGPLALILLVSLITPLYHVRYLFTYSPAFYVVLAAGLAWLWRNLTPPTALRASAARREGSVAPPPSQGGGWGVGVGAAALIWLAAAAVTLRAFWFDPVYRADDHRAAVHFLQERWRPGDVVLVNAGWPYTALTTYWHGPVAGRSRLTDALPARRADDALVIVTTGHINGDPDLGWADPQSDFFALPADIAESQITALFRQFDRVWHYRIYDTVNDPAGRIRAFLAEDGRPFEDQVFPGEAFMRVQGFLPRAARATEPTWPSVTFGPGLTVHSGPLPGQIAGGQALYAVLDWQFQAPPTDFATSVRLVAADGVTWAQGADERPAGPGYPASHWPAGETVRQTTSLPIPPGTPPGAYSVELVVYDPATGQPWPRQDGDLATTANGVRLGQVAITRATEVATAHRPLARFGPLALIEAATPATTVAPGGQIPLTLLWQAVEAPGEPLVIVAQLQDAGSTVVAGLEEEPVRGRYPTQAWAAGELVRDRHTLSLPADLAPGEYRLIVGLYRAADRARLQTRQGLFGESDHWVVKKIAVR